MKTLKFLKDFREYKTGEIKTFESDHKADSILLVEGVAVVTDNHSENKEKTQYNNKMLTSLTCEDCGSTYKNKSGLKRHKTIKH